MNRPLPVLAAIALGAVLTVSRPARAWYFPEHAEVTRLALQDEAPAGVGQAITRAVSDAIALGFPLCSGVSTPFHAIPLDGEVASCVSYGALAALAGDHSTDTAELWDHLGRPMSRPWPAGDVELARLLTGVSVAEWVTFQTQAPTALVRIWTSPMVGRSEGVRLAWISTPGNLPNGTSVGSLADASPRDARMAAGDRSARRRLA